jgi:hypothetical protein
MDQRRTSVAWHTPDLSAILHAVEGSEHGLTAAEAAARLKACWPNRLPRQPPPPWWEIVLRQFRSPLLLGSTLAAQALHIVMLYLPLGRQVLRTEPRTLATWLVLLGLGLAIFVAVELHKWTWNKRYGLAAFGPWPDHSPRP